MEVLSIKAVFPTGLTDNLKAALSEVVPIFKPEFIPSSENLKGHWIAGFTQADGSFGLNFYKSSGMKLGESLRPSFRLSQNERDLKVLERIIIFLALAPARWA